MGVKIGCLEFTLPVSIIVAHHIIYAFQKCPSRFLIIDEHTY